MICACGCNQEILRKPRKGRLNKYIHGHHRRGATLSDKSRAKISEFHTGRKLTKETRKLLSESKKRKYATGEIIPYWLGRTDKKGWSKHKGRISFIDARGYRLIQTGERKGKIFYDLEHRVVMEKSLGRKLLSTEVVHHIDGDKLNNHISNLMLFSNNADHVRYHLATVSK